MPFDIIGAKQAGYDDPTIAKEMAGKYGYDYEAANKAGHSDQAIIGEMLSKSDAGVGESVAKKAEPYLESAWEGAKKVLGPVEGALATVGNMTVGQIPSVAGGLGGLARFITTGDINEAEKTRSGIQGALSPALTYEPKTEGGKYVSKVLTSPFTALNQVADYAGGKVADSGHPMAGAAVSTAIQAAPFIIPGVAAKVMKGKGRVAPAAPLEEFVKDPLDTPTFKRRGIPLGQQHAESPLEEFASDRVSSQFLDPAMRKAVQQRTGRVESGEPTSAEVLAQGGPVISRDALDEVRANEADPTLAEAMAAGREDKARKIREENMARPVGEGTLTTPYRPDFKMVARTPDEIIPPSATPEDAANIAEQQKQIASDRYGYTAPPLEFKSNDVLYEPNRINFEIGLVKNKKTSKTAVLMPPETTSLQAKTIAQNAKLKALKQNGDIYLYDPAQIPESTLRGQIKSGKNGLALGYGTPEIPKEGIPYGVDLDGMGTLDPVDILALRDSGRLGFSGMAPDIDTAVAKIREMGRDDAEIRGLDQVNRAPVPPTAEPTPAERLLPAEQGGISNNASGQTDVSTEAVNELKSRQKAKVQTVIVDSRSGKERPAIGIRPEDNPVNPFDVMVRRYPDGREEVLQQGVKARPLKKETPLDQKQGKRIQPVVAEVPAAESTAAQGASLRAAVADGEEIRIGEPGQRHDDIGDKQPWEMTDAERKKEGWIEAWHGSNKPIEGELSLKRGGEHGGDLTKGGYTFSTKDVAEKYRYSGLSRDELVKMFGEPDAKEIEGRTALLHGYLNMRNPLIVDAMGYDYKASHYTDPKDGLRSKAFMEYIGQMEAGGHDGIIFANVKDTPGGKPDTTVYFTRDGNKFKVRPNEKGETNVTPEIGQEQQSDIAEHQKGDEIRETTEASGGDSTEQGRAPQAGQVQKVAADKFLSKFPKKRQPELFKVTDPDAKTGDHVFSITGTPGKEKLTVIKPDGTVTTAPGLLDRIWRARREGKVEAYGPEEVKTASRLANESGKVSLDLLMPGFDAAKHAKEAVQSLVLPTARSAEHLRAGEELGAELGAMDRRSEIAANALKKDSRMFDKAGVNDETIALEKNEGVKFMSDMSQGRKMPERLQKIADKINLLFQDRLAQLKNAGAELQTVRENYFPGMWTNESRRAFNQAMGESGLEKPIEEYTPEERQAVKSRVQELLKDGEGSDKDALGYLTRKPFKGKESFRKQKVFDDIMDGVEFGLEPISRNPIDLVKLKLAEMDRSIMANKALRKWEAKGDVKFLRVYQDVPEGWVKIKDKYGTVYGPPTTGLTEYVNKSVYDGLMKVADEMGLDVKRPYNAGPGKLGYAERGTGTTVTQFATDLSVLAHEISHQLDFKHDLWNRIVDEATGVGKRGVETKTATAAQKTIIQKELRAISDLKWEGTETTEGYKKYTRKKAEKMAHLLEAYIQANDRFQEVAPNVYKAFDSFLRETPETQAIVDLPRSLTKEALHNEKYIGLPILGYRIAKKPVADIMNNYLSSSLYNNQYFGGAFKGYMGAANLLNQSQLGVFSAFHAGFISSEVTISAGANIIKDLYGVARGNRTIGDLGKSIVKMPTAMIKTPMEGAAILDEWRNPGTRNERVQQIAKAAELAGAGFERDTTLMTHQTDKMVRDWYGGNKVKAALRSPVSLVELSAKPIMEWLVPRQKAGVFGELAGRIIDMNPGKSLEELTPQFRQAWNRVDARLGQVRYNRLFINNVAKNVMQGFIRAPGWSGGTIAEIGGSVKDVGSFFKEWYETGKAPENIPDRVAYTMSLLTTVTMANALLTYAFTGEKPEGMDYWAFRTGGKDEQGRPERFLLPTYAKDIFAYYENWQHTLAAKTHPLISLGLDLKRNKDYYGNKIYEEDDHLHQQMADMFKYGARQFIPFWMRGAGKEAVRANNVDADKPWYELPYVQGVAKTAVEHPAKILGPEVGIMPATSAYTKSKAEKEISKVYEGMQRTEGRTKEQADYHDLKSRTLRELRSGKTWDDLPAETWDKLENLSQKQLQEIDRDSQLTPLQSSFKHIADINDALRVWKVATPKEREELDEIYQKKIDSHAKNLSDEEFEKFEKKVQELEKPARTWRDIGKEIE